MIFPSDQFEQYALHHSTSRANIKPSQSYTYFERFWRGSYNADRSDSMPWLIPRQIVVMMNTPGHSMVNQRIMAIFVSFQKLPASSTAERRVLKVLYVGSWVVGASNGFDTDTGVPWRFLQFAWLRSCIVYVLFM